MADSVVKIRIDSQEYDAKLKKAGDALNRYFDTVRKGGGTLKYLDEGVLDAVKAMGSMETTSSSARQKLRELTQTTADLLAQYRALSDEERATPLGAAMSQSISELTERAGTLRDAMDDVNASVKLSASDTKQFDMLAGGVEGLTTAFQLGQGAMELFGLSTEDNVEVIAKLQAAMAVTSGLQQAQNLLQKESAMMQGVMAVQASAAAAAQTSLAGATGLAAVAQKAFNLVANANPYVLLATAVAAVGTALYAFCSASEKSEKEAEELAAANEEARKKANEARQAFVNAAADSMNTASRLSYLQEAYAKANTEIGKTNVLRQAQQEFKKLGMECNSLSQAQELLVRKGGQIIEMIRRQGNVAAMSAIRMEVYKKSFSTLLGNGYDVQAAASLAGYNHAVRELDKQINEEQGKIQGLKSSLGVGNSASGGGGGRATKVIAEDNKYAADSIMAQQKEVERLTDAYNRASAAMRGGILADLEEAKSKLEAIKKEGDASEGGELGALVVTGSKFTSIKKTFRDASMSDTAMSDYISGIKSTLDTSELGSDLYNSLTSKLSDANMAQQLITQMIKSGVEGADLTFEASAIKEALLGGEISDEQWKSIIEEINTKIADSDMKIHIDIETGELSSEAEAQKKQTDQIAESWKKTGSAIQSVGSAMQQIENPAAKVMGTIAQAVATIALSYAQAMKTAQETTGPWGWIAFAATGMATMFSSINAIRSATAGSYATGGIIPGNDHNDGLVANVSSGELILNRAQQGNIASQLESDRSSGVTATPYVNGENIYFGVNNALARRGQGELVTTAMLRRKGINI